jgi:hypothetical protein
MVKLTHRVGENILAFIPSVSEEAEVCKLHAVEVGGLWLESQMLTETYLKLLNSTSAPQTPVFFLPYGAIGWIMAPSPTPALAERILQE